MPTQARHILVKTLDECDSVMGEIAQGLPFAEAASKYSTCPSAKSGGSLGSFEPGKMVREFDEVCFDPDVPVGEVTGPVRTQFGYHLILVEDRFQNMDRTEGSGVFKDKYLDGRVLFLRHLRDNRRPHELREARLEGRQPPLGELVGRELDRDHRHDA